MREFIIKNVKVFFGAIIAIILTIGFAVTMFLRGKSKANTGLLRTGENIGQIESGQREASARIDSIKSDNEESRQLINDAKTQLDQLGRDIGVK